MAHAPPTRDSLIGTIFEGKYRIDALLAVGGMGRVYRGEQIALGRRVAIKVMRRHVSEAPGRGPDFVKRFSREASLLSQLQHPNIVTVYDYGQASPGAPVDEPEDAEADVGFDAEPDRPVFIVMELLEGETLHARLRRGGALPPARVVPVAHDLARGLRDVHRRGLVHRDLKPANVMLVPTADGEVAKLLDFGLVKSIVVDEELTYTGTFVGSPLYMSPEQMAQKHVDHRSDVYSLGVLLYQCLAGVPPFSGTYAQLVLAHVTRPAPPLAGLAGAEVPPALDDLVRRCLAKEPRDRPQTMDEIIAALDAYEGDAPAASGRSAFWQVRRAATPLPPSASVARWAGLPSGASGPPATPDAADDGAETAAFSAAPPRSAPPASAAFSSAPPPSAPPDSPAWPRHADFAPPAAVSQVRDTAPPAPEPDDQGTPTFASLARPGRPSALGLAGGRRRALALAWAGVLAAGLGGGLVVASRGGGSPASTAAALRAHEVTLHSAPEGALVREGGAVIGATPLTLVVDDEATRHAPRRLLVELAGYRTQSIALEAGASPRTLTLPLEPLPAAPASPERPAAEPPMPPAGPPRASPKAARGAKKAPPPAASAAPVKLPDIRLER